LPGSGRKPVIEADEAVRFVEDGHTLFVGGSGGGIGEPTTLLRALGERFEHTGSPRGITVWHCSGVGDRKASGLSLIAREGLLKRVVGGHWGMAPEMARLALEDRIEAYNFPQGAISQLMREIAGGRPGLSTPIGVGTFVDPRLEGGRLNAKTTEDLVRAVELGGRECLFYPAFGIDVAFIRATTADELGNLTFEEEAAFLETLAVAQATRASGGKVIAQVKYLAEAGTLHPQRVKVPGVVVDATVVDIDQQQTCLRDYEPSFSGAVRTPVAALPRMELNARKVVARRAALEIPNGAVVNLGVGIPDGVASVAAEEGWLERFTFAIEQGHVGGVPAPGVEFGAAVNPLATVDQPYQFDFFGGGGLDVAFLGMAQVDAAGNVNVSRYGGTLSGCGGFVDITQGTQRVVFCGTFTAGGLEVEVGGDELRVVRDGRHAKFIRLVEQVTFSGERAVELDQEVLYVTERAVFRLDAAGLELVEIAPGVDIERDVLERMEFEPVVDAPKEMSTAIFRPELMGES
jgi:acyl CoA:acetate/3-ketoacid CoA transferase